MRSHARRPRSGPTTFRRVMGHFVTGVTVVTRARRRAAVRDHGQRPELGVARSAAGDGRARPATVPDADRAGGRPLCRQHPVGGPAGAVRLLRRRARRARPRGVLRRRMARRDDRAAAASTARSRPSSARSSRRSRPATTTCSSGGSTSSANEPRAPDAAALLPAPLPADRASGDGRGRGQAGAVASAPMPDPEPPSTGAARAGHDRAVRSPTADARATVRPARSSWSTCCARSPRPPTRSPAGARHIYLVARRGRGARVQGRGPGRRSRWARSTAAARTASTSPTRRPRWPPPTCAIGCIVQRTSAGTQGVVAAARRDAAVVRQAGEGVGDGSRGPGRPAWGPDLRHHRLVAAVRPGSGEDDLATAELIERARRGQPLRGRATAAPGRHIRGGGAHAGHRRRPRPSRRHRAGGRGRCLRLRDGGDPQPNGLRLDRVARGSIAADADDPRQRPRDRLRGASGAGPPLVMLHGASHVRVRDVRRADRRRSPTAFRVHPPRRARPRPDALGRRPMGSAPSGWSTTSRPSSTRSASRPSTWSATRWAAMTALGFASRAPERLRTLVVVGITTEREPRASVARRLHGPGARSLRDDPAWAADLAATHDPGQGPAPGAACCRRSPRTWPTQPLLTPARAARDRRRRRWSSCGDRDPLVPVGQAGRSPARSATGGCSSRRTAATTSSTTAPALVNEALLVFYRSTESIASARADAPVGGAPMTTLLALYRRPEAAPRPRRRSSGATPRSTCRSSPATPGPARDAGAAGDRGARPARRSSSSSRRCGSTTGPRSTPGSRRDAMRAAGPEPARDRAGPGDAARARGRAGDGRPPASPAVDTVGTTVEERP